MVEYLMARHPISVEAPWHEATATRIGHVCLVSRLRGPTLRGLAASQHRERSECSVKLDCIDLTSDSVVVTAGSEHTGYGVGSTQ